jgi:hypothetical protein
LISDDVAVLRAVGDRITVAPGSPRMKMRTDAARSLLGSLDSLEPTWSEEYSVKPKRYLTVPAVETRTHEAGRALDVLYVLNPWSEAISSPSLHPLKPARALPILMAHRHMTQALNAPSHRRDFEVLARLAETTPACDLTRPAGLETIEPTVAAIVSDVRDRS